MSTGGIIAALAIGGGAALILLRRQQAAQIQDAQGNPCDKLPAGTARDACNAARGIGGVFGALGKLLGGGDRLENVKKMQAHNDALNGAPDVVWKNVCNPGPNPDVLVNKKGGINGFFDSMKGTHYFLLGSPAKPQTIRYRNGCVPFEGAPGWEKCAPGTRSMQSPRVVGGTSDGAGGVRAHPGGNTVIAYTDDVLRGSIRKVRNSPNDHDFIGDPTTGYSVVGSQTTCGANGGFPLKVPAGGTAGWYRGRPWTCPAGTMPRFIAHVTDAPYAPPACVKPGESACSERPPAVNEADAPSGLAGLLSAGVFGITRCET